MLNFIFVPSIYILLNKKKKTSQKDLLYEHNFFNDFTSLTLFDFINYIDFIDFIDFLRDYENIHLSGNRYELPDNGL